MHRTEKLSETAATIDSHEISFNTIRHVEYDIFVDIEDGQCMASKIINQF